MTKTEVLMISAVIVGPILAVQVQKIIEFWREKRKRKIEIFKTLMATRGNPVSFPHVQALNMIDLEFCGNNKKEKEVSRLWKLYLDNLGDSPQDHNSDTYKSRFEAWTAKNNELLVDLLYAMGACLGYDFDKVHLKKGIYVPKGHTDLDNELFLLRQASLDVLFGDRAIPVTLTKEIENKSNEVASTDG